MKGAGVGAGRWGLLLAVVAWPLTGCGDFFVKPGSSTGTTSSGGSGNGGNYVYVSNGVAGSTSVNGYVLSSGTLVAAAGSPYTLSFTPTAMAINPANSFLYVATTAAENASFRGIFAFTIGTGGGISSSNSGVAVASGDPISIDVSPDGQWLVALDSLLQAVTVYQINSTTGALTLKETLTYIASTLGAVDPSQVRFSPSGKWVVVALGTAGDLAIPFSTTTGVLATSYNVIAPPATAGDFALALDGNDFLYLARTGLIASYALDSQTPTVQVASAAAGAGPRSVALSSTGNYAYVANQSDGTITAYGIGTSGALTKLTGSPFEAPASVGALLRDRSGSFLVAAGYGTTGLEMFTIGTGGGLTLTGSAATGKVTTVPVAMAVTH